jgi:hypothetical protein
MSGSGVVPPANAMTSYSGNECGRSRASRARLVEASNAPSRSTVKPPSPWAWCPRQSPCCSPRSYLFWGCASACVPDRCIDRNTLRPNQSDLSFHSLHRTRVAYISRYFPDVNSSLGIAASLPRQPPSRFEHLRCGSRRWPSRTCVQCHQNGRCSFVRDRAAA